MAFNLPAQTGLAPLKPTSVTTWTRPADWPTITDTANEVQFLVADTGIATYAINTTFSRTASQNLLIDWGDGNTDTISTTTSVTTQHTYTVGTGTPCTRGYTTFVIRIYGSAAGVTITNSKFVILTTAVNGVIPYAINTYGVLEAYFGDGFNASSFANYFQGNIISTVGTSQGNFGMLEYCKLPSTFNANAFQNAFDYCYNLAVLVMPTSAPNMTSFSLTFRQCNNLQSVTFPSNATGITTLANAFNGCSRITSIILPATLNSCTTLNQTFYQCYLLNTISLPALGACTDYSNAFYQNFSLVNVKLTSWTSTGVAVNISAMFSFCVALETFIIPNPVSGTTFTVTTTGTFNECKSLKQVNFPTNWNFGVSTSVFLNCTNLIEVTFPSSMSATTTMINWFNGCTNLQSVTLPNTVGATLIMNGTFIACTSLRTVTIPSGITLTDVSSMCSGCSSLQSFTFPTGSQNSLTTLNSSFLNCTNLTSVTLPSSMNALGNLISAFQNCTKLESVTFPASLNGLTTMNTAFSGCQNLSSVTLPTSTSLSGSGLANVFINCYNLIEVTLPATVLATCTGYASVVQACTNLKTLTLPTVQTTSLTALSNAFASCPNLTTINNVNKLGDTLVSATTIVAADTLMTSTSQVTSLDFYCKFSKLALQGTSANRNNLTSLRLRNSGTSPAQWGGSSPQLSIAYTNMSAAAINQVFTDLPTVTSKTIDITGATGAATCTRSIATGKGWTVTG